MNLSEFDRTLFGRKDGSKDFGTEPPPVFLYKFCTRGVYRDFISKGKFRFGATKFFRDAYEKGSGFGDNRDGIFASHLTGVGMTVEYLSNANALCFSKSYSEEMHQKWWARPDCNYNYCIKFDGPLLINSLKEALSYAGKSIILHQSCVYRNTYNIDNDTKQFIWSETFMKGDTFEWEDEYRLAALKTNESYNDKPLDIEIVEVEKYIVDLMGVKLK